jgi:hypothetical protein
MPAGDDEMGDGAEAVPGVMDLKLGIGDWGLGICHLAIAGTVERQSLLQSPNDKSKIPNPKCDLRQDAPDGLFSRPIALTSASHRLHIPARLPGGLGDQDPVAGYWSQAPTVPSLFHDDSPLSPAGVSHSAQTLFSLKIERMRQ